MVINVDEGGAIPDVIHDAPESVETGAIRGDDRIEMMAIAGFADESIRVQEPQFVGNRILVPDADVLSLSLEGEAEPELEDPEDLEQRHARDVTVMIDGGHLWPEPSTVLRFDENGDIEVLRVGQGPVPDW